VKERILCAFSLLVITCGVGLVVCVIVDPTIFRDPPNEFVIVDKEVRKLYDIYWVVDMYVFYYSENNFVEVREDDYYAYEVGDYFTKNYTILH